MSRKVFTETYGQSQEKVFFQVENELNDFHTSLQKMTDAIDSSWAFRLFLDSKERVIIRRYFRIFIRWSRI